MEALSALKFLRIYLCVPRFVVCCLKRRPASVSPGCASQLTANVTVSSSDQAFSCTACLQSCVCVPCVSLRRGVQCSRTHPALASVILGSCVHTSWMVISFRTGRWNLPYILRTGCPVTPLPRHFRVSPPPPVCLPFMNFNRLFIH
jgi:hypothetical protein